MAVPRDHDLLASLDGVEQAGKVGLGVVDGDGFHGLIIVLTRPLVKREAGMSQRGALGGWARPATGPGAGPGPAGGPAVAREVQVGDDAGGGAGCDGGNFSLPRELP